MRRYIPNRPSRREIKAAMAVYEPLPMFKQSEGCWSVANKRDAEPCGSKESQWYELDSKTSNIGPGTKVRVRLCPKHATLAARHYVVTKVVVPYGVD